MSESVRWCQCVSVVPVICVFSCYDASSVNGLYLVTCSLGARLRIHTWDVRLGRQIVESDLRC